MGTCASTPKPGDNPQACVSFYPQVCTRKYGQEWCPLHPGHKLTLLCSECKILLCVECVITSADHKKHTKTMLSKCLREPSDNIEKQINNIDSQKKSIEQEMRAFYEDLLKFNTKHQTQLANIMTSDLEDVVKSDHIQRCKRYQRVVSNIHEVYTRLHKIILENIHRNRLDLVKTLESGSDVMKYDTGMYHETAEQTPNKPQIPELTNIKDYDDVMDKLQYEMETISKTYNELLYASMDIDCMVTTMFNNESRKFYSVTPVSTDKAWVGESRLKEHENMFYTSNVICQITSKGSYLRRFDIDCVFSSLSVHPITGQLYVGSLIDETVRCINTTTGSTTTLLHCEYIPFRIKVTHDDHVLVGTWMAENIYRYNMTGELVHKSTEQYKVADIEHCPTTNLVLLSCAHDGAVVLDNHLNEILTFTGLSRSGHLRENFVCFSATFDNSGNIIVGDHFNKEIYILDGEYFGLIHRLNIDGLSYPHHIRLYQNTLWVKSLNPEKIMCIMMPY